VNAQNGACMVAWRDSLIVFGGQTSKRAVQQYNITSGLFYDRIFCVLIWKSLFLIFNVNAGFAY
jgi:hypothetical protein